MTDSTGSTVAVRIRLTATFTAEPLAGVLGFWGAELALPLEVSFAPYGQVFQDLLGGVGAAADATQVVLLRVADWLDDAVTGAPQRLVGTMRELAEAVRAATRRGHPVLVVVCPSPGDRPAATAAEAELERDLAGAPGVQLIAARHLLTWFPSVDWHQPYTERLAAAPYTEVAFAALATVVARGVHAAVTPRPKVIAVDCDNTIWDGELSEAGISLPPARRRMQQILVEQAAAGRLVCLCTRNSAREVQEVLEHHPDMVLRPHHIAGIRAGWDAKSTGLRSLAEELDLGLDSFLFLDDDPLQVAEVRANAPEVLALRVPADAEAALTYLRHCWPLDAPHRTAEDAARTRSYRDNRERELVRRESVTMSEFLRRLELQVTVRAPREDEWARAAQLTGRTNQFNLTGVRRDLRGMRALVARGCECLVVDVRDRFGVYGLVGLLILETVDRSLSVDTFLLSCRSLGRGVEYRMLAHVGEVALQRGLTNVRMPFRATERNVPAADFLHQLDGRWEDDVLVLAADRAAAARYEPGQSPARPAAVRPLRSAPPLLAAPELVDRIATDLADPGLVVAAARAWRRAGLSDRAPAAGATGPRTRTERQVMDLWADLVTPPASVHDEFFGLGGDSLTAVLLLGRVLDEFGVALPADTPFQPSLTVAGVAAAIDDARLPTGGTP
jgi:FkbH-like protein